MYLDLYIHAPDRAAFVAGMTAYGFATLDEDGRLVPAEGVLIDEAGTVRDVTGTDAEGWPIVADRPGWYANLRGYGPVVAAMTAGIDQYDAEGNLRPLFERTRILSIVPGLVWTPIGGGGVPAGYTGAHGVRVYDPASVATPIRCWA